MTNRVVTITLNPAIDLTGEIPHLKPDKVNIVDNSNFIGAGKGLNVAKVLSDLGLNITVTGFLGENNDELFTQHFSLNNLADKFIRVAGTNRTNVKLVEQNSTVTDINFPGFIVNAEYISQLNNCLYELAKDHDYFIFSGSLPCCLPPQIVAEWMSELNKLGKRIAFDSSKQMLKLGIEHSPWMIKPNDHELAELMGHDINSIEDCANAASHLVNKDIDNILISMGEKGVLWINQGEYLYAPPPKVNIVSTVDAGDTLVAGFCWGALNQLDKEEHIAFATALGALAVSQVNVGVPNLALVKEVQQKVQVQYL